MELHQLRCFVAVAEELHLARAARRMASHPEAVASAVRILERGLQVRLFDDSSHRLRLTPTGMELLPEAQALVMHADNLMRIVGDRSASGGRHHLVLGLFLGGTAAAELTYPIIDTFRHQHAQTSLQVVPLDLNNWATAVMHGLVDAALVPGPFGEHEVDVAPLFEEPRVVTVAATHPLADADRLSRADLEVLQRDPWSSRGSQPRGFHDFFLLGDVWDVADLRTAGPATGTLEDVVADLARGRFVGAMPLSIARQLPSDKAKALVVDDLPRVKIGVASRPGHVNPMVQAFVASAQLTAKTLLSLVPGAALA